MGTISKGILGGFSGKVGTVVGGNWKGIEYMRSRSGKRTSDPSPAQLAQQVKFALVMKFLQPMAAMLEFTFRDFAIRMTGINSAFAYTIKNAVTGTYPAFAIAYPLVLISRGDLPNVLGPSVVAGAGSILTFSWTNNAGVGVASNKDEALFVAYCPAMQQAIYYGNVTRGDLTGDLNASTFAGQLVETYISFAATSGRSIATSIYTGQVTVS